MDPLSAPGYWLARLVFERGLALIYLLAFVAVLHQFRPLLGERGLMPVPEYLRTASLREAPSLFQLRYSDRLAAAVGWAGVLLALGALLGITDRGPLAVPVVTWLLLWLLYLSVVNVGQVWYSFGWESLLLEAGFLAIFLGPSTTAPPAVLIWVLRWLLVRLELGAGLIKLRGDPCWRRLTCLDYHHETQPMPNPLSWYFHHLPRPLHRVEVLGNHLAQVVAPLGLALPQPVPGIAGVVMVVTQLWLVASGNFSWLNALTIALTAAAFDNGWLHHLVPLQPPSPLPPPSTPHLVLALLLAALVAILSWWPLRNLLSRRQVMNHSFNRLHLVNTYGAFGSVTRERLEVVIEGTSDPSHREGWREYGFWGKPGDPRRLPPQVAPYHLRLDWLMWFAALSPAYADPWFIPLVLSLLRNDRGVLRLLRHNPFPDTPPAAVRAQLHRYRFTSRAERRATGAWWSRELVGPYLPPVALRRREDASSLTGVPA